MKEEYIKLLKSGMFWEFYPQLSGEWEKDKDKWLMIMAEKRGIEPSNVIQLNVTARKINLLGEIVNQDIITMETSDKNPMYVTIDVGSDENDVPPVPTQELINVLEDLVTNLRHSMLIDETDMGVDDEEEDDEY